MIGHRFFKVEVATYQTARQTLDALFGHPNGRAETCLPPEPELAADGRALVAVRAEFAAWPEVEPLIEALLGTGEAVEVSEQEYFAALPQGEAEL